MIRLSVSPGRCPPPWTPDRLRLAARHRHREWLAWAVRPSAVACS